MFISLAKVAHGMGASPGRDTHARTMPVEAARQASRGPPPLRAFLQRVSGRTSRRWRARKLAVIRHLLTRGEDYAWVRPALRARKLRDFELRSGESARRGQRGAAYAYNLTRTRQEERRRVEQAETTYRRLTEGWSRRGRRVPTGAAKEERP